MPPRHTLADPSIDIRPSGSRHRTTIGWLDGRHSFDTGIDPFGHDTHHGLLVVHNHDTIAPQGGFDTHPHRDMEIVTWVVSGTLVHQDSEGHNGAIYPNLAQRMSAGTGIWHSEKNDGWGATEPVDLVQMWVIPDEAGVTPGYQQLNLSPHELEGKLAVVASGIPKHLNDAAIRIRNRWAALHVGRLEPGQSVTVPDAAYAHVYLARGRARLEGADTLDVGDAARLTAAGPRWLQATLPTEVLIWEMHTSL
jgi:redox-sensitive bicupin YhaK (pirin superfamily)